ncbi:Ribosomal protein 63, mitochondrial [Orchesella cincta]|uniref:Ribosomal protein 63, mitochondrial n=1 Tax=Orchesella cincta TaxID=48709 RepID=A0A1D2MRI0_ORCCI|nr:Ribosomal protein 63, mitochondrial [Orchesella cincta]
MRLTLALLKKKMPNGYIWAGKHRLAHHVYPHNIQRMVTRLQIEEKNMLYLRHPYLTPEQDRGHAIALDKHEDWIRRMNLYRAAVRVRPSVRLEEKFDKLRTTDSWEV